ncbi:Hypothetical predicted protein, partial [Paramuricea clavata]
AIHSRSSEEMSTRRYTKSQYSKKEHADRQGSKEENDHERRLLTHPTKKLWTSTN